MLPTNGTCRTSQRTECPINPTTATPTTAQQPVIGGLERSVTKNMTREWRQENCDCGDSSSFTCLKFSCLTLLCGTNDWWPVALYSREPSTWTGLRSGFFTEGSKDSKEGKLFFSNPLRDLRDLLFKSFRSFINRSTQRARRISKAFPAHLSWTLDFCHSSKQLLDIPGVSGHFAFVRRPAAAPHNRNRTRRWRRQALSLDSESSPPPPHLIRSLRKTKIWA